MRNNVYTCVHNITYCVRVYWSINIRLIQKYPIKYSMLTTSRARE